jgi:hypothetical protein
LAVVSYRYSGQKSLRTCYVYGILKTNFSILYVWQFPTHGTPHTTGHRVCRGLMYATVWEPLDNTGEVIEHTGLFFLKIAYSIV